MDINTLRQLERDARKGDITAKEKIMQVARKDIKKANARLLNLEKRGVKSEAYERALYDIEDGKRWKNPKTIEQAVERIQQTEYFMNLKTSTYRGWKSYQNNLYRSFEKIGVKVSDRETFNEFLNSDFFNDFVTFDSDRALKDGSEAFEEKGLSIAGLNKAYEEYKNNKNVSLTDAWEMWTRGEFEEG